MSLRANQLASRVWDKVYTMDRKSDTPLVFEFSLLLHALYLQFLFTYSQVVFIKWRRSSSANVNQSMVKIAVSLRRLD